jgi:Ni,Fe-hydrogenase III large subunit
MKQTIITMHNGMARPVASVPLLAEDDFLQGIIDACDHGWRVASYFGVPDEQGATLYCLLAFKADSILGLISCRVGNRFPSIAALCPQLHLFEREIAEQCGIVPDGHPWLKPVRFQRSLVPGRDAWGRDAADPILPGVMDFYRVEGEEVHEVAVGPVHAGIIEPGHFRFQCHGEVVFNLEISLGYQHRGIEASLLGGPDAKSIYRMETLAGDTTIGHTEAYCMILEGLSGVFSPARAEATRAIALELERLANHTGDLGAIAGDVGYLPTSSFCGRIRGDFLNMSAVLCGSRFGRGLLRPGGVGFDPGKAQIDDLLARLAAARADLANAVNLLWTSTSVMARLESTGTVSKAAALETGLVGPAARACGISRDVRRDHPFGLFRLSHIPSVLAESGDVYARTLVRWLEAEKSLDFVEEQLRHLPGGAVRSAMKPLQGGMIAVALTEGWRGEICHVAITDDTGRFARYKVVDPSFHNWTGVALALRNEQISDFPLCNKSFNLSYCGFDL